MIRLIATESCALRFPRVTPEPASAGHFLPDLRHRFGGQHFPSQREDFVVLDANVVPVECLQLVQACRQLTCLAGRNPPVGQPALAA